MNLSDLGLTGSGAESPFITGIQMDSRRVLPGNLFVCWPGTHRDSHEFLADAKANGAVAAIAHSAAGQQRAESLGLVAILWSPDEFADRSWRLCDQFFDHPTRSMKVVGVTGTNGKTTVCWILRDALEHLGMRAAYIGTLGVRYPGVHRELPNTTPFVIELYNLLAELRDAGVEALAMEVSSHALAEKRADGVEFDVAVFTNLSQDHLDFHGTMEAYAASKARLFRDFKGVSSKPMIGVFNLDDSVGRQWHSEFHGRLGSFTVRGEKGAAIDAEALDVSINHLRLQIQEAPRTTTETVTIPLGGAYNVENSVAAIAALRALGFTLADSVEAMAHVHSVPGRFEPVPNHRGLSVLVDYAHSPDALEKLLAAVRPLVSGRVITVFGCGGDRDRTKRPLMAKAASAGSDYVVATSDNPRTEDPVSILGEVAKGLSGEHRIVIDRREAIFAAIQMALPGDAVVIAGKGHENYQILGREKTSFDDRLVAAEALA
jgi:UDP-N-acetylmuramoyl-L-alanyl-D-glutamate--2,6-diaminopimelate ligase